MTDDTLAALQHLLLSRGVLDEATVADGVVSARARLDAADVVVEVLVDPDPDDDEDGAEADLDALIDLTAAILSVAETRWREIVDAVASEIEEAVGDASDIVETIDLREDLDIRTVVVLPGAVLLSFAAPRQFPDSWIRAQLDADSSLEFVEVDVRDTGDDE